MRWCRAAATSSSVGVVALAAALMLGQLGMVTTSGISMEPRVEAGDLVVVRATGSYAVGDAAAYRSAQLDTVVLHRIVGVEGDRYVFQGDNNDWLDPEKPTLDDLIGKELLHIPSGGIWLSRLTSAPLLAGFLALLFAGGLTAAGTTTRRRRKDRRDVSAGRATPGVPDGVAQKLQPVLVGALFVAALGGALAATAATRPTTTLTAASTATQLAMDFSYTAEVPASPVYDGTTVNAPDPVFRSLTSVVDVTYAHPSAPGDTTVTAHLSTPSGWTAIVPLDSTQPGRVRLDIAALEQRAAEAAAVIGLPTSTMTIDVVPTVRLRGGGEFAPRLTLAVDKHALKATSDLRVVETASASAMNPLPSQLSAFGHGMPVTAARVVGVAALLLGLAAAAVAGTALRLRGPVAEAERVRQQHGSLLLTVLPVAFPPGRPVIDVPDVAALVRLAERYGLLVLHWSRSGVDTYVVQDESTTFRYRAQPAVTSDGPDVGDPETVTEHEDVQIARTAAELLTSAPLDVDPAAVVDVDSFQALRDVASLGQYKIHFADDDGLRFYFVLDADTAYRYYSREAADRLDAARATAAEQFGGETVPAPRRPEQRTARSFRRRARV